MGAGRRGPAGHAFPSVPARRPAGHRMDTVRVRRRSLV